ncbi:MAG: hypothetical protein PVI40_00785, partial [Chlamydiota bacterium]
MTSALTIKQREPLHISSIASDDNPENPFYTTKLPIEAFRYISELIPENLSFLPTAVSILKKEGLSEKAKKVASIAIENLTRSSKNELLAPGSLEAITQLGNLLTELGNARDGQKILHLADNIRSRSEHSTASAIDRELENLQNIENSFAANLTNSELKALFLEQSQKYCQKLTLSQSNLRVLSNHYELGFAQVDIEDKIFRLIATLTGSGTSYIVQVVCENDPSLNIHKGEMASFFNVVPPEWHEKILERLTPQNRSFLHEKIELINKDVDHIEYLGKSISQGIIESLELSKNDLNEIQNYTTLSGGGFYKLKVDNEEFSLHVRTTFFSNHDS